jgi:hypothetical protein
VAQQQVAEIKLDRYVFKGNQFQGRNSTTTKDQRLSNCYIETIERFNYQSPGRVAIVKRPGIDAYTSQTIGEGRGLWEFNGSVWYVIGNILYKDSAASGTVLTTTTGIVGNVGCTTAGIPSLFFCDGTKGYVIDNTNTVTLIVDADFPSPHVPAPAYIDGYVCVIRANSADVYNCDLETPTSWTASNFLTAELFSDHAVSLARQNNQIVVFGENSTEFFYNNGANQPTGTPLARNQGAFMQVGTPAPYAVGQNERYCFFVGSSLSGGHTVWKLDGFQPTPVSTDAIDRVLNLEGVNIANATSFLIRLVGHFFFVLRLTSRTFVYDIDEEVWHEWTSTLGNNPLALYTIGGSSAINSFYINKPSLTVVGNTTGNFAYKFAADLGNGQVYLLGASTGTVAVFNESSYVDVGQIIYLEFTTPIIDYGTTRRKFMHQLTLVGDLQANTIQLRWSDNDYQTYSSYKSLSLTSRPVFTRLGMFRRRNLNMNYIANSPFRLEGLEIIYSEGES